MLIMLTGLGLSVGQLMLMMLAGLGLVGAADAHDAD